MMLFGAFDPAELELRIKPRDGGARLRGKFPYNRRAVLSDGGRKGGKPKKEQFASRAFSYNVKKPDVDVHLLVGHDFDKPLASKLTNTLALHDSDDALTFEARVTPQIAGTTHGRDALAMLEAGLQVGLSPGFSIPPPRAVPTDQAEKIEQEPYRPDRGMHGAIIRTVLAALLWELSLVTRPAYPEAKAEPVDEDGDGIDDVTGEQIAARNWTPSAGGVLMPDPHASLARTLSRWR